MRLTMDGTVVYATYLGGSGEDDIEHLTVDPEGAAYVVGSTTAADFPKANENLSYVPPPPGALVAKISGDGTAILYATVFSYAPPDYYRGSPPIRISVDSQGEAHTATCFSIFGPGSESDRTTCHFWRVDQTGALRPAVAGTPSQLFAMDHAGAVYFGTVIGANGGDVSVTKVTFGVTSMSVTASVPLPARFGIPITWTAQAIADDTAEYKFVRYSVAAGWIEAKAFGPSSTYTWTPKSGMSEMTWFACWRAWSDHQTRRRHAAWMSASPV